MLIRQCLDQQFAGRTDFRYGLWGVLIFCQHLETREAAR